MKKTVKVSIGGFAFNLEEDAHQSLDNYLISLKSYFKDNAECTEIISDVELRIAELLQLRVINADAAITIADIEYVTSIIGSTTDFNDEESTTTKKREDGTGNTSFDFSKKRLYRDTSTSLIGGVCSGLGHYLKIDVVIVRISFVLTFLLFNAFSYKTNVIVALAYFILWIVVPKAKTLAQKITMTGTNPTLESIENRESFSAQPRGGGIVKAIKIVVGVILGIICFAIIVSVVAIIATSYGIGFGTDMPGVNDIFAVIGVRAFEMKTALIMVAILPLLGIAYFCLKLIFQSRFTSKSFVASGLMFLLWIFSIAYAGGLVVGLVSHYRTNATFTHQIKTDISSDTLYVDLGEKYKDIHPFYTEYSNTERSPFSFYLRDKSTYSLLLIPEIVVQEDSILQNYRIEIETKAFEELKSQSLEKAKTTLLSYSLNDSLFTLNPSLYSEDNQWDRVFYKVKITTPVGKKVVLKDRLTTSSKMSVFFD